MFFVFVYLSVFFWVFMFLLLQKKLTDLYKNIYVGRPWPKEEVTIFLAKIRIIFWI